MGYLKIAALTLWAYILININVTTLQGMERPRYALVLGVLRQIVFPVPILAYFVLVAKYPVEFVWWGFAGVTWVAAAVTVAYTSYVFGKTCR